MSLRTDQIVANLQTLAINIVALVHSATNEERWSHICPSMRTFLKSMMFRCVDVFLNFQRMLIFSFTSHTHIPSTMWRATLFATRTQSSLGATLSKESLDKEHLDESSNAMILKLASMSPLKLSARCTSIGKRAESRFGSWKH